MLKAIRNIEVFNKLFPESAYKVIGFARDKDGNFNIVMEQPFVRGKQYEMDSYYDDGIAEKVIQYFEEKGLNPIDEGVNTEYGNEKYFVQDIHYGNVVEDNSGNVHVIDANVKYNEGYKKKVYGEDGFVIEDVSERRYDEGVAVKQQQTEQKSRIAQHIDNLLNKLGTKSHTTVYNSLEEVPEDERKYIERAHKQGKKVRGWYENGQIYLFLPDIESEYEAEKTIWHETVAHHGLRNLIGEENYK